MDTNGIVKTDYATGEKYLDYDDYMKGREAIIYFHNAMVMQWPDKYNLELNQLIKGLQAQQGGSGFLDGIGLGIIQSDATTKTVKGAMEYLALKSKGKIPTRSAFVQAIANQLEGEINFTDISTFVVMESAKDVLTGLEKTGNKIINTGDSLLDSTDSLASSLKWMLPIIIVGGSFIYIYLMPKRG